MSVPNQASGPTDTFLAGVAGAHSIQHRGGVPWSSAPLPRRLHRCTAQSWGWLSRGTPVQRCACGAFRMGAGRPWINRNQRRRRRA